MTRQDRQLIVETLGEMRELKGEMKEFKLNVIERVQKLEKKESERSKERHNLIGIIISAMAVLFTIIFNLFNNGGSK